MKACLGGLILPYFSELINSDYQDVVEISNQIKNKMQVMQSYKPQVVVLLSPRGTVVHDAVTVHAQPRLKGNLKLFGLEEQVLVFETEHLLIKTILNQGNRLGIEMQLLTNDFLVENQLDDTLCQEALVPLYFLAQSGYKGQIVHLNYGDLFYEEMYTLGKVVQLAIDKVKKRSVILVGTNLSSQSVWNHDIINSLKNLDIKLLLEIAKNKPEDMQGCDFRALFFLIGVLSKLNFKQREVYYKEYLKKGQLVANFFDL